MISVDKVEVLGVVCSLSDNECYVFKEKIMFTKKEYEHCVVYYNPYEDVEVLQGITDCISVDVYVSGQHVFECIRLDEAINYLHEIGVDFITKII